MRLENRPGAAFSCVRPREKRDLEITLRALEGTPRALEVTPRDAAWRPRRLRSCDDGAERSATIGHRVGELAVIPAGRFLMGSPEGEEGRYDAEGPRHEVVIGAAFALGRYRVTFDEHDAFCEDAGRGQPSDSGRGRGDGR